MDNTIAAEIEKILEKSWNKFIEYYNEQIAFLSNNQNNKENVKGDYWICWNEYDLMFHVGRIFYETLKEEKEKKYTNIHIHFEKKVNKNNFQDYYFEDMFVELSKKLGYEKDSQGPKIDMIITYEDKLDPFLVCVEMKYFHGHQWGKATDLIKNDIKKLKALKECGIAQKTIFMLLDNHYCRKKTHATVNEIKTYLNKIKTEDKEIKILDIYMLQKTDDDYSKMKRCCSDS